MGRRTFEPRLSNASEWQPCRKKALARGHVVEETQCRSTEDLPQSTAACDEIISTHVQALSILTDKPQCTDAVIDALVRFGRTDGRALSDVAAAYYVRAQRQDRPSDFLRAVGPAEQSVIAEPTLPAARFNLALVQEALGLSEEATASWEHFLTIAEPSWANEAREHLRRLKTNAADSTRWQRNAAALPAALESRDGATVARLIEPFPSAAQRYFEEVLLPQWAASPTQEHLDQLTLFAKQLSLRLAGDRFPIDVVNAISRTKSAEQLTALRKGHRATAEARSAERSFRSAATLYRDAYALLSRGGSPFRLRAALGQSLFEKVADEAGKHGYHHLLARTRWARAHSLTRTSYMEALRAYDVTLDDYIRLNDPEGITALHSRRAGVLRVLGDHELAWREVFYAKRHAAYLMELKDRNALLLEAGLVARALGYPQPALAYQSAAVRLIQNEIRSASPEDVDRLTGLKASIAAARRHRASTEAQLGHAERAEADLAEAIRLSAEDTRSDANILRALKASANEVRGQSLLRTNPAQAVQAFTLAINGTPQTFRTVRASLLAQRAEAQSRVAPGPAFENDLRRALDVLREEEMSILATRKPGADDDYWNFYFGRFQDTYRVLIRQLIDSNRPMQAFVFAERARAVEPLDLLRQRDAVPEELRMLAATAPRDEADAREMIAEIQRSLPAGTYIIEYCVLEDRTYAWVISRDSFELRTLKPDRATTERWSKQVQTAARQRNRTGIEAVLRSAFDGLAADPLAATDKNGRKAERLVLVPDGAIHGLPLVALQNVRTGHYLIEHAPIEISGSTALYLSSLRRDRALPFTPNPSIFIIGDPAFDESLSFARDMARLPFAQLEAEKIYAHYAPNAEVLIGTNATATAFLERASQHEIVHIAAHAIVNASAPSHSLLLLAPATSHSGAIDAQELLNRLKLDRTRLVILSTCSSAGGLPVGPEGVAPFVRPLLAAGVPGVIGSLWDVSDATTEELMVSFHRHYLKGSDAAVAMRNAQLELLRQHNNKAARFRSVLAWAPFQVIGHASSPYAARAPSYGGTTLGIHTSNSLQRPDRLRPQ